TIIDGEEFSMISMESLPSLRQHLSPSGQVRRRDSSGLVVEPNLSLVDGAESEKDKPWEPLPNKTMEKVAHQFKPRNRNLLSVRHLDMDDSFSSIPSEILEAATPGRDLQKATATERAASQGEVYEDSFSAIPSTILEGANTASLRQSLDRNGSTNES